jgi:hypothetical protein
MEGSAVRWAGWLLLTPNHNWTKPLPAAGATIKPACGGMTLEHPAMNNKVIKTVNTYLFFMFFSFLISRQ